MAYVYRGKCHTLPNLPVILDIVPVEAWIVNGKFRDSPTARMN